MIIQIVRFKSALPQDRVVAVMKERKPLFDALPGLKEKYFVNLEAPGSYGGVYIWETKEAIEAYRQSDLFASIPEAYKITGVPEVEVIEAFSLE